VQWETVPSDLTSHKNARLPSCSVVLGTTNHQEEQNGEQKILYLTNSMERTCQFSPKCPNSPSLHPPKTTRGHPGYRERSSSQRSPKRNSILCTATAKKNNLICGTLTRIQSDPQISKNFVPKRLELNKRREKLLSLSLSQDNH